MKWRSCLLVSLSPCLLVSLSLTAGQEAAKTNPMFPPDGPAIPTGLVPIIWPDDNPYTPAKAELGWLLFFDKRLSSDGTVACASCHSPDHVFTDGRPVSTGIG